LGKKLKLMFLAGEASGDAHGAALIREVRKRAPGALCFGFGGPAMQAAGMRLDLDLTKKSVIGLWEVLKHLGYFRKAFAQALDLLEKERPDVVVPIDYPGFNLRFAEKAHARGVKVCYYISPQVWAWKAGRVHLMKRILDKMLVVFPFEVPLYEKVGLPCAFVGHPLVDAIPPGKPSAPGRRSLGARPGEVLVGLLPGSRQQEVRGLLPAMLESARLLTKRSDRKFRFLILKAPGLDLTLYRPALDAALASGLEVSLLDRPAGPALYGLRRCFDLAMVASGTATLETAILGTPFVILYRVHPLSYQIGKRLVKLPYIGLANVVAGSKVVPEFVQDLDPRPVAQALEGLLPGRPARVPQLKAMARAVKGLGGPGAARRAADELLAIAGA
jgi:lipid-A-disaccharide synthase